MRALVYDQYGPPEKVLRLEQVPRPQPGPGEVLVRVHAAALNSWDWDLLTGTPMGRVMGPFKPPFKVLGADIAGVVEAAGAEVTDFAPGDHVFGDLSEGKWGGLADYVAAPAKALAKIPDRMTFQQAAAIPQAGCLALQALRKYPDLGPSHHVLINGAGGGVGTFAIQLAKVAGAVVTVVDKANKRDALLALGADSFIDYAVQDFTADPGRYDLVIDMVARRRAGDYIRCLNPGGRLVVIGGTFRGIIGAGLSGLFQRQVALGILVYKVSPTDALSVAAGARPIIDSSFPLEQGSMALRRLGDGNHIGKVIVDMGVDQSVK